MLYQIHILFLLGIFPWVTKAFPNLPLEVESEFEIVQPMDPDFVLNNLEYLSDTDAPDAEYLEHDIMLPPVNFFDSSKAAITNNNYLWTDGFFVQLDKKFTTKERKTINAAIRELRTMLKCVNITVWNMDADPTGDYVYLKRSNSKGCYSYVGRVGGKQILNLQYPKCIKRSTLLHEMIHALGFWHEQSRSDRDDYVTVNCQNIKPSLESNYRKSNSAQLFTPYDQQSVMHYKGKWFSKNGKPTLTAKNGQPLGWQGKPTKHDVQKIRMLYGCEL